MAQHVLENEPVNRQTPITMFDPREPTPNQYRADWTLSDQSSQALALAQLALTMAKTIGDGKTNLEEDATRCLPGAHRLLRRALEIVQETPLDEEVVPEEKFYTYDELCSGETKNLSVGKLAWKPLAKEGSSFRTVLIDYAKETVERDLKAERPFLDEQLCEIIVSFDNTKEDKRRWLIDCISNQQYPTPNRLSFGEACDLVNGACRQMPQDGKRTMEWAVEMITEGAALIADQRYKNWMADSKDRGLPEAIVTRLIGFRNRGDRSKGSWTKKRA